MTHGERTERLRKLQHETNQALSMAYEKHRRTMDGAINWSHLHCVDAAWVVSLADGEHYQVTIEEASPTSDELRHYVHQWLEAAGFGDVVVLTEW